MLALLLMFFLISTQRFGKKAGALIGVLAVLALLNFGSSSRIKEIDSKEASAQGRIAAWSKASKCSNGIPSSAWGTGCSPIRIR